MADEGGSNTGRKQDGGGGSGGGPGLSQGFEIAA